MASVIAMMMFAAGCASSGGTSGDTNASGAINAGAGAGTPKGPTRQDSSAQAPSQSGSAGNRTEAPSSSGSPASPGTPTSDAPTGGTPGAGTADPSNANPSNADGGSTPAPGAHPTVQLDHFQSPSGNIACMIIDDATAPSSVRCDVLEHTFVPPQEPASGCGATGFGNSIELAPGAPARFICAGDTVADPSLPILAYGTTSAVGSFSCDSNEDGMVCVDLGSGHWFRIAKASYSLN